MFVYLNTDRHIVIKRVLRFQDNSKYLRKKHVDSKKILPLKASETLISLMNQYSFGYPFSASAKKKEGT